jgi:branched-chain amino acid transport system permease protein
VFTVTRVIFIPQGEFVAYGALTLAILQTGKVPGTVWLLLILAAVAALMDMAAEWKRHSTLLSALKAGLRTLVIPVAISGITILVAPSQPHLAIQALLSVAIVTAFGPLVYRVAYQSLADATSLVLLIVSVGVHFAMTGLGLLFFGAEGFRNPPFWDMRLNLGPIAITGQMIIIGITLVALIAMLWMFFERSLYGKALRATAVNRLGARLMGISSQTAGQMTFAMAALIGALSGLLIGPSTTVFYDSGFLIGLKGFVAAVIAGLSSYPGALIGAMFVGVVESFGSFWASAFKEVIVFTIILPVLLARSLTGGHSDEDH